MRNGLLAIGRFLTMVPRVAGVSGLEPGARGFADRFADHAQARRNHHIEEPHAEPPARLFIDCAREIAKPLMKTK